MSVGDGSITVHYQRPVSRPSLDDDTAKVELVVVVAVIRGQVDQYRGTFAYRCAVVTGTGRLVIHDVERPYSDIAVDQAVIHGKAYPQGALSRRPVDVLVSNGSQRRLVIGHRCSSRERKPPGTRIERTGDTELIYEGERVFTPDVTGREADRGRYQRRTVHVGQAQCGIDRHHLTGTIDQGGRVHYKHRRIIDRRHVDRLRCRTADSAHAVGQHHADGACRS